MKRLFLTAIILLVAVAPLRATGLQELSDAIDEIESKIDDIDLDQSKSDIQDDLDAIKAALEDLKGEPVVYQSKPSKGQGFKFVPVHPKAQTPVCTP